jgi:hypothetical protein
VGVDTDGGFFLLISEKEAGFCRVRNKVVELSCPLGENNNISS